MRESGRGYVDVVRVIAVGATVLLGCYNPTVASEVPCGPHGECPIGQTCNTSRQPPLCNAPDVDAGEIADAPDPVLPVCGDSSGLQPGAPWPTLNGCASNAGRSATRGPATGAVKAPPFGMNNNRRGNAVTAANLVLVQETGVGDVFAYDGTSGGAGWQYVDTFGAGSEPGPAVDNLDQMFLTTNYGKIYCVDAIGGGGKWDLQFGGSFSAPQIGPTGILYFGSIAPYGFYAVDVVARMQKFHYDVPGDATTAPALGNGFVYFVDSTNSRLYALDAISGDHKFDVPIPGQATGSPVVGVDIVYVATKTNGIAAFDALSGEAKWQEPQGIGVVQPALLSTGHVVTSSTDGQALVLARTTGATKFLAPLYGTVQVPPVIDADDNIYYSTSAVTASYTNKLSFRWDAAVFGRISLGVDRVIVLPSNNMLALIGE